MAELGLTLRKSGSGVSLETPDFTVAWTPGRSTWEGLGAAEASKHSRDSRGPLVFNITKAIESLSFHKQMTLEVATGDRQKECRMENQTCPFFKAISHLLSTVP